MGQVNIANPFTVIPGTSQPSSPVLPVNANRQFLQVCNNGSVGIVRIKFDNNFSVPANQVEQVAFNGVANAGTFIVTDWLGHSTAALAYTTTASQLQTALQALGAIGSGNCTVAGSVAAGFTVTFTGTLAQSPLTTLTVASSLSDTTNQQSAIQDINFSAVPTAGTFIIKDWLGNATAALAWNASDATILTAVNALTAVNNGVASVNYTGSTIALTFGAPLADQPVPLLTVVSSLTNNGTLVSAVQTLYFEPLPQQGTFCMMFLGQTTAPLAYNATAAQIQTAFQALSTVGAGNCIVSGSMATGFSFAFTSALADAAQPLIEVLNGPPSQYGVEVGETGLLHADNLAGPQLRVTEDVKILTATSIAGVGPVAVTAQVANAQAGIAPTALAGTVTITTLGVAPTVDGVQIPAGKNELYTTAVPMGQMFIISDTANVPVAILEG